MSLATVFWLTVAYALMLTFGDVPRSARPVFVIGLLTVLGCLL